MAALLTKDIKPEWLNVIRRLQSVARHGQCGCAVIGIKVLVDENGTPIFWTNPDCVTLEPKARATADLMARLSRICASDDQRAFLSDLLHALM